LQPPSIFIVVAKIRIRLVQQLLVGEHSGEDLLRIARVDQHVPEGVVESRHHDHAAGRALRLHHDGIGVGSDQLDAAILQPRSHSRRVIAEIIEQIGAVAAGQRVRGR
jgi:hypothetical protein